MDNIIKKRNIFLEKSYQNTWEDYQCSLTSADAITWDWLFITASNETQAVSYRMQIEERIANNYLPKKTKYVVLSDPDGKRIGSGGATLNVLKYISEHSDNPDRDVFDVKILVIHSGGDSKRIPQYSACGKLFSPVPRQLPDGRRSILFDEIIISLSSLPNRMNNGMLTISGDVLLVFNPLQIDLKSNKSAVAISVKEFADIGANHGVFLSNNENHVMQFLHKQSVETMRNIGAVDENECVDLDTGAIWFDKNIMGSLFSLVSSNNKVDYEKFDSMVNDEVRLSFYGDFQYPLAESAIYNDYLNSEGENSLNDKLLECRKIIWSVLNKYKMSLVRLSPAKFIHLGTTHEVHKLVSENINNYKFLGWSKNVLTNISNESFSVSNSYINPETEIGKNCYIEDCYIGDNVRVGNNVILSNLNIKNIDIPDDVTIHGIELNDNKYCVRIYGINDNPKDPIERSFFYRIFDIAANDLWTTDIYPVCDNAKEAMEYALIVYKLSKGTASDEEFNKWKNSNKTSLERSFKNADVLKTFKWRNHLENIIRVENFIDLLNKKKRY